MTEEELTVRRLAERLRLTDKSLDRLLAFSWRDVDYTMYRDCIEQLARNREIFPGLPTCLAFVDHVDAAVEALRR